MACGIAVGLHQRLNSNSAYDYPGTSAPQHLRAPGVPLGTGYDDVMIEKVRHKCMSNNSMDSGGNAALVHPWGPEQKPVILAWPRACTLWVSVFREGCNIIASRGSTCSPVARHCLLRGKCEGFQATELVHPALLVPGSVGQRYIRWGL